MPRKKIVDPIDTILTFAESAPTETIGIVVGLLNRELKKRQPAAEPKPVTRRRRIKSAPPEIPPAMRDDPPHDPTERTRTGAPKRRRRMRANSQPPTSEATPIVPLQTKVGEDAPQSYEGN